MHIKIELHFLMFNQGQEGTIVKFQIIIVTKTYITMKNHKYTKNKKQDMNNIKRMMDIPKCIDRTKLKPIGRKP